MKKLLTLLVLLMTLTLTTAHHHDQPIALAVDCVPDQTVPGQIVTCSLSLSREIQLSSAEFTIETGENFALDSYDAPQNYLKAFNPDNGRVSIINADEQSINTLGHFLLTAGQNGATQTITLSNVKLQDKDRLEFTANIAASADITIVAPVCGNGIQDAFEDCTTCFEDWCTQGQQCFNGQCQDQCPADTVQCDQGCANLQIDPNNCGACQLACAAGETCVQGACEAAVEICGDGVDNNNNQQTDCDDDACAPLPECLAQPACQDNAKECIGQGTIRTCVEGAWQEPVPCALDETCANNQCERQVDPADLQGLAESLNLELNSEDLPLVKISKIAWLLKDSDFWK